MTSRRIDDSELTLVRGDITEQQVEGIVNAANSSLLGGGGVDGAIHRAGGPEIKEECQQIRDREYPDGLPPGQAVATTAGELPAHTVIHTVGPRWQGGDEEEAALLASAYRNSLRVARREQCRTVALPSISTGAYGYPTGDAARVALRTTANWLADFPDAIQEVRFVLFSEADYEIYEQELGDVEV